MSLQEEIHRIFFIGDKITNKEVKNILQRLYNKHQIDCKAQATHLKLFGFRVKRVAITKGDKRIEGLQILF